MSSGFEKVARQAKWVDRFSSMHNLASRRTLPCRDVGFARPLVMLATKAALAWSEHALLSNANTLKPEDASKFELSQMPELAKRILGTGPVDALGWAPVVNENDVDLTVTVMDPATCQVFTQHIPKQSINPTQRTLGHNE